MNKQIEEMAQEMAGCGKTSCETCRAFAQGVCASYKGASRAQAVGYRKQIEGEWNRSERGKYDYFCTACGEKAVQGIYGNHDRLFKFCPNCGAKMKGGETDA